MKKSLLIAAVLALSLTNATAAKIDGAPTAPTACEGLRVATGPVGKGYAKLYRDMASVSKGNPALCQVNSDGGLDNLDLLSNKKADVAIVPLDALKQMSAGDANIAKLLTVATLNSNYLHIVVSANGYPVTGERKMMGLVAGDTKMVRITKLADLAGKPVALVGSAQLMVSQLDKQLGLKMQYINVDADPGKDNADAKAQAMVKSGQAYAAFSVAGWPHGKISNLKQDSGLTMIGFDMNFTGPYTVRPISYKGIGVYNVQALAVQNILVTRPFTGTKNEQVAALKRAIAVNLDEMKDGDFEPAWNEISSLDASVDWPNKFGGGAQVTAAAPVVVKKKK